MRFLTFRLSLPNGVIKGARYALSTVQVFLVKEISTRLVHSACSRLWVVLLFFTCILLHNYIKCKGWPFIKRYPSYVHTKLCAFFKDLNRCWDAFFFWLYACIHACCQVAFLSYLVITSLLWRNFALTSVTQPFIASVLYFAMLHLKLLNFALRSPRLGQRLICWRICLVCDLLYSNIGLLEWVTFETSTSQFLNWIRYSSSTRFLLSYKCWFVYALRQILVLSSYLLVLLTDLVCQICVTCLRSDLHQRNEFSRLVEPFDSYFCCKGFFSILYDGNRCFRCIRGWRPMDGITHLFRHL